MEKWISDTQCTACGACMNICPVNAISMENDKSGFACIKISDTLCINCKKCESICPVSRAMERGGPKVYAAWSKDEQTRYHSTSGGVFSELARNVIAQAGVVFGAVYGKNQLVYHEGVTSEGELERLRQSKYVQSEIGYCFRDIKERLEEDMTVLFCGSPCQVAGLKSYLGKPYQKLYTVDFVCRGINSSKAYGKWVEMLENKYHSKAARIWFKNKEIGWNRFCTRVDFENGKIYREDRYHDLFMRGYLEKNFYIRPSCGQCQFKGLTRHSDLTLADFWGINKQFDANKGTSMVIVHTTKGQELLSAVREQIVCTERPLAEALNGNPMLLQSVKLSKCGPYFLEQLDHVPFDRAFAKASRKLACRKWKKRVKQRFSH